MMVSTLRRISPFIARIGVLATLSPILACSDGRVNADVLGVEPYAAKGQFLELTPDVASLASVGERLALSAAVRDARGKVIPGARVDYRTSHPGLIQVDASGTVTGLAEGVATVIGTSGAASDTVVVAVAARKLNSGGGGQASVAIYPAVDTIDAIGGTIELRAVARNRGGRLVSNPDLKWASENPGLATVSSSGTVTAHSGGIAYITATLDNVADTAMILIAPPGIPARVVVVPRTDTIATLGGQRQLRASVLDGLGNDLQKAVAWTSLDGAIATVDANGLTTGHAKGLARIVATHGSLADTARVWVGPTPVPARITVAPKTDTIATVGGTKQLNATVVDATGAVIPGAVVVWNTLDPAVATVTSAGRVTGQASGMARVTAKINTLADTAIVWVAPNRTVASVRMTPRGGKINGAGGTLSVQAAAYDASGAEIPNLTFTWKSLNVNTITVSTTNNGQQATLSGVKLGEAAVTVATGARADTAWFHVASDEGSGSNPATIDINPASDTIKTVGDSLQLVAKVMDQSGKDIPGATVTWATLDAQIATVDAQGRVRSLKQGMARITATHSTLKDTARVYVAPGAPVASSVRVTPRSAGVGVGQTVTLKGEVLDQFGNPITSLTPTWSSLNPSVATVNGGVVNGVAVGSAPIRAAYGSFADTAQVTVSSSSPAKVTLNLTHGPASPSAGTSVTLTAAGSPSGAVKSIVIEVDGATVKTCTAATCSHVASYAAGSYTYRASAVDTAGNTVTAGPNTLTVRSAPSGGYSATSPHWRHMRTATIDYRIHYQPAAQQAIEYDWAAARFDHVTGGDLNQYKKRNPTISHFPYDTYWFVPVASAPAAENWLAANGYNVENAYLHYAGTSKTKADRVTAQQYAGRDYWYYNMADPGFRAWRQHTTKQRTAVNNQGFRSDGLFLDTNNLTAMNQYIPNVTLEYGSRSAWMADHDALLATHRSWVPSGFLVVNMAQYFNRTGEQAISKIAGGVMTEFVNGPFRDQYWSTVDALVNAGVVVEFTTTTQATYLNDARNGITPGNYNSIRERVLMWMYVSYLMVVNPQHMDRVLFEPYIGGWTVPMSTAWVDAFEYDIGLATAPRKVYKSGSDPAGQWYQVYSREFENALVLIRPKNGVSSTNYGDLSAVDVDLPSGTWHVLYADGSRGGAVTRVQLRLGESLVLLK